MEQEQDKDKAVDVANEPVDRNDKSEFMDTGVLHQERPCTSCGSKPAAKGSTVCVECAGKAGGDV